MKGKKYEPHEEEDEHKYVVNDPALAYVTTRCLQPVAHTMSHTGKNTLRRPVSLLGLSFAKPYNDMQNDFDYIRLIREGLPKTALDNITTIAGFTPIEIAHIIHTSDRTLRRYTPKQKLDAEQSERVLELARLYSRGEEVFGTMELFKSWMNREVMSLGEKKPKTFLDTSMGIDMLIDELGRIEQGVFA